MDKQSWGRIVTDQQTDTASELQLSSGENPWISKGSPTPSKGTIIKTPQGQSNASYYEVNNGGSVKYPPVDVNHSNSELGTENEAGERRRKVSWMETTPTLPDYLEGAPPPIHGSPFTPLPIIPEEGGATTTTTTTRASSAGIDSTSKYQSPIETSSFVPPPNKPTQPVPAASPNWRSSPSFSLTPSPPPSPTFSKRERGRRVPCLSFVLCIFHSLSAFLLLGAFIMSVIGHDIILLTESTTSIDSELRNIPYLMSITSILLIIILVIGFMASFMRSKTLSYIYISGLVTLLFWQAYKTYQLNEDLKVGVETLTSTNWDELSLQARSAVQMFGTCCGYNYLNDRPGTFCPINAQVGCRFALTEVERSIRYTINEFFLASFLMVGLLSTLIYLIAIYRY